MNLRKLSVKVPNDVALIGFDDVLYFSFTQPSISAIDQPVGDWRKSFALRQIEEWTASHELRLPSVDIIIREIIKPNHVTE